MLCIFVYHIFMDTKYTKDTLNNSKRYNFMLELDLLDWLEAEAARRKVSVSQLIREAIEFYMRFTKAQA